MTQGISRGALLGMLLVVAGCSLQALPLQGPAQLPALAVMRQVPALLGVALGRQGLPPACSAGRAAAMACLQPYSGADAEQVAMQLPASGRAYGFHRDASALLLGQRVEGISLVLEGARALESLPARLSQLCGVPAYDSRMDVDGGGYLRALAWRCPDAEVQFTAVLHAGQARGALDLTTAHGRAWLDSGQTLAFPAR